MSENRDLLVRAAKAIGNLAKDVVFVGSAILDLLIDEETREAIHLRTTEDIDLVVQASTRNAFYKILEAFRLNGFSEDMTSTNLCRLQKKDIKIDIIPSSKGVLGFTNFWYKEGISNAFSIELGKDLSIKILSAPYFLASKIEAFFSRGLEDPFTSKDLEDIVDLVNGRQSLLTDIKEESSAELSCYLSERTGTMLQNQKVIEAIHGHFYTDFQRASVIIQRLKQITALDCKP